jgi:hypothetical protein
MKKSQQRSIFSSLSSSVSLCLYLANSMKKFKNEKSLYHQEIIPCS